MIGGLRSLGTLVVATNLMVAVLWALVWNPALSHADLETMTHSSVWDSSVLVGPLLLPNVADCAPRPAQAATHAPDGRPVAQLSAAPSTLASSISATITPCAEPRRSPSNQLPVAQQVSFRILSKSNMQGAKGL